MSKTGKINLTLDPPAPARGALVRVTGRNVPPGEYSLVTGVFYGEGSAPVLANVKVGADGTLSATGTVGSVGRGGADCYMIWGRAVGPDGTTLYVNAAPFFVN